MHDQVVQLLQEQIDVDDLLDDEADIERQLQPARAEDQQGQRLQPYLLVEIRRIPLAYVRPCHARSFESARPLRSGWRRESTGGAARPGLLRPAIRLQA